MFRWRTELHERGLLARLVALISLLVLVSGATAAAAAQVPSEVAEPDLDVFVGEGCPHCARALVWIEELGARRPELSIRVRDVVRDRNALDILRRLAAERDLRGVSVPTFVVQGEYVHVGFYDAETTGRSLEQLLAAAGVRDRGAARAPPPEAVPPSAVVPKAPEPGSTVVPMPDPTVSLPWVGTSR